MNIPSSIIFSPPRAAPAVACCLLAAGCASPIVGNAPPAVVEECRLEVEQLTEADRLPPLDESLPKQPGGEADTIDDARLAKQEQDGSSLTTWPEDVLLYRCFASRGVVLTEEQAAALAEWQSRMEETTDPD